MPALIFIAFLGLERKSSFLGRHQLEREKGKRFQNDFFLFTVPSSLFP